MVVVEKQKSVVLHRNFEACATRYKVAIKSGGKKPSTGSGYRELSHSHAGAWEQDNEKAVPTPQ